MLYIIVCHLTNLQTQTRGRTLYQKKIHLLPKINKFGFHFILTMRAKFEFRKAFTSKSSIQF